MHIHEDGGRTVHNYRVYALMGGGVSSEEEEKKAWCRECGCSTCSLCI